MENRKLDTDLSTEELLKALDNKEDTFVSSDPVFSFIQSFELKPGKTKIKLHLLYDLFKEWNKFSYLTSIQFKNEMAKYFTFSISSNIRNVVFLLNASIMDIVKHIEKNKKPDSYSHIKYKNNQKRFDKFIEAHDIKPGSLFIESDVFFHIYDTWTYKNNITITLSYEKFVSICHLYFDDKHFAGSELTWFGVDSSIKQYISTQAVSNWRQGRTKRGKKSKVSKEDQENIIYPETQEQEKSS